MGRILFYRESNWSGAAAVYNIYIDDEKVGKIGNGSSLILDVKSGEHKLYLKNGLISFGLKSNVLNFSCANDSVIKVRISSNMSSWSGISIEIVSNSFDGKDIDSEKYDSLEKLMNLKNKNIISEEEYKREKEKIMNGE